MKIQQKKKTIKKVHFGYYFFLIYLLCFSLERVKPCKIEQRVKIGSRYQIKVLV